ncbi:hypothetical protein E3N88_40405 [Mikania micrantha]|uniref:NADP-dependent oxidoreductase domain-containing protein n=1 Tax=Mikania micrantha TaxID=192012 RepID=A0A5N6LPW0_9ASTR|nr:hypothetical protein E3N88_40405 [Mikania micrantha]
MATVQEKMISSSEGPRPIPVIALGTATESGIARIETVTPSTLIEAIKMGYRHFDSAAVYGTEKPVGEAIAEALRSGLIKSRSEVFVTTKLWCNDADRHLVVPAIKKSLRNLGLDYIDLYLIHWPFKITQEELKLPIPDECIVPIDIKAVWEGMEECQNLGLAKSIGVSNFSSKRIKQILSFAKISPALNQIEMNPLWQQKKLREFCKKNDILVTAYSPLGAAGNNTWGHSHVMECDVLQNIARSKGKTLAQIEEAHKSTNNTCVDHASAVKTKPKATCVEESTLPGLSNEQYQQFLSIFRDKCSAQTSLTKNFAGKISLRWLYEQGVIIAIKSFNTERMKKNLDIFDWSLTQEELNKIDQIPQRKYTSLNRTVVTEHNDILAEIDADID